MNAADVAREAVNVAWDVLQTLATALKPSNMAAITTRCGVPPVDLGADWSAAVARIRGEMASDVLGDAERAARVMYLMDMLTARVQEEFELESAADVLLWLRPLVAHVGLTLVTKPRRRWIEDAIVWASVLLLVLDARVQESMLGASPVHRTEHGLWPLIEQYANYEVRSVVTLMGAVLGIEQAVKAFRDRSFAPGRLRFGFDVPAYEPPPSGEPPAPVNPLALAREAARWTFAVEYNRENIELTEARYDAFDPPGPVVPPFTTGFRMAFVPVPPSSRFDADDISRPAMVHVSLGGDVATTEHFGDDTLSYSVSGDAGILVPMPLLTVVPRGWWLGDWGFDWEWPPGSFVEATGAVEAAIQYATAARPRAEPDPDGVSLTVDRFVAEARVSATAGLVTGPGTGASLGVVSARVDVEGVTLTIGRIPGLAAVLEHGASASFDVGVMATLPIGGALEFGFRGAAGAELVIPIQRTLSIGPVRIGVRQARVQAQAGRAGDSADAPSRMALTITGDLVVGIKALTLSIDGVGVALTAGATEQPDGNIAGVADVGWAPVWPRRIGIEVACASFHGAGFVDYDAAADRWSGGGEFVAWSKLTLRALFVCEPALTAGRRSWLALATAEFPSPAWFVPKGVGILYARNRTTDPVALLAAVAAGDLEALLFPTDIAGRGPAYLATLGRLLPAAADGWVAGIFLRFAGAGGKARVDLGVMYDAGAAARAYLLARVQVTLPSPDAPLVRIEIAALGVWDRARDEYELRAALVNSHLFGGELTGEALMFSGDPDHDDARSERVRLISVGGFHPKFVVPGPAIRAPERITLLVQQGDHLRLECQAYLAITPGALHAGLEATLVARFAGFGIRGNLGFDALINTSFEFAVSIRVGVALYLGSRQLLGASFEGDFGVAHEDGFPTTYLRGRARISLWFFDYETPRFTIRLARAGATVSASRDPEDSLYQAILEPSNWDTGGAPGLVLRAAPRPGVWASPSAALRFSQSAVPLDVAITHFEGVALPAARTLAVTVARPAGASWQTEPVDAEFAPAMFFALTAEEQLAARGFEALPGGVAITRPLVAGPEVVTTLECEDLVIDSANPPERARPGVLESVVEVLAVSLDPHQLAAQHWPPRRPPRVRPDRFAVIDRGGAVIANGHTFAAALGRARQAARLEVVPMREVA